MTANRDNAPENMTCPRCDPAAEHPQPFMMGGKWYCGRCRFKHHEITEMTPVEFHLDKTL
jgi:ribosomal protein S27AE